MPVRILTTCALAYLAVSTNLLAAEWRDIQGIYAVTSPSLIDPSDDEVRDSHYRIQLRGSSARDLYEAIKVTPIVDECTGGLARNVGDMQCLYFERDHTYECHFSIDVMNQRVEYGVVC